MSTSFLKSIHHVAVICSDYRLSKAFYCDVLGFVVIAETYREQRDSYKLDLALPDGSQIELFSFPDPPKRPSRPESCGLRHIAFEVDDLDNIIAHCKKHDVIAESIRIDEFTNKRFTFIADPDDLPIEFYEK